MKKITEIKSRNLRTDRNSELVRRMRNGDQLTSFNSQSSWYPPRPIIEKDQDSISKLYGRAAKALRPEAHLDGHMNNDVDAAKESHLQIAD